MIFTTIIRSPLGPLVTGVIANEVCFLEFDDPDRLETQWLMLQRLFNCPVLPGEQPLHHTVREQLDQYFSGDRQVFSLPLAYPGSDFQQRVWRSLLQIPYGSTRSYEEISRQIGAPRAVRAVGTANGRNRLAILIPCHRVVNKDGKLGGYGGGLWRKQWLLDLEQRFAGA